jgi:hypothetical protein
VGYITQQKTCNANQYFVAEPPEEFFTGDE